MVSDVHFAALSPSGVRPWKETVSYAVPLAFPSRDVSSGSMCCVGGEETGGSGANGVYIAPMTSSGLGPWHASANYPSGIETTCVVSGGYLGCLGGFESATCSASLANLYCLDGNVGSSTITASSYHLPLSVLTPTDSFS